MYFLYVLMGLFVTQSSDGDQLAASELAATLILMRMLELQEDLLHQESDAMIEERQRREREEAAEEALSLDRYFEECEERFQEAEERFREAEAAEEESAAAFANLLFWDE